MDPVSLITGIPDLVERCIQGYNFLEDVKNAPKACLELMEELDNARARLAELQEHVNKVGDKEKVQLSASLQNYATTLDKLDSVLKVYRDPKFKFDLVKRTKWAWSGEKKIKALCDDMKQNSGNFQPLLIQIAKNIGEMNKRQEEADAKTAEMNKHQQEAAAKKVANELARRLQEVVKWLEPLNSEAKLREVRKRRQPETCEWLPSHNVFISWYSSGSFLWLNGIPGNGKTLLASFVIDYLERNIKTAGENIVLFAFADFQDVRSTDVVVLLRTLLAQMFRGYKPENFVNDFGELEMLMQQHYADPPRSVDHLIQLLEKASAPWKRVFIVIDALDECTQDNRREYIASIRKLVAAGSKFSIFVTSRGEQNIMNVLSGVPTISLTDEAQRVQDDIRRFIKDKMNTSYLPLARLREPVRTHITSTLLKKSEGMFRLVDCQLQALAKVKFEKDIDNILQNLPADLNSMYERILQSIEEEGQEAVQVVQRTLWWLVGSHRQLRLVELMEAVMVETGKDSPNMDLKPLSGEHFLEMCSSLVCHDAETDILTLSHASVQEFLFSDYLKGNLHHHKYHIPSFSFLHQHTTYLISTYLHYEDFQNGPCTTPQNLAERLERHPLFAYVASSWHLYIVKMYETCSESGEQPPDIDTFFFALSDDSEKSILARRSRRQVSYFGTELRYTTNGSSELQWQVWPHRIVRNDLHTVTESKNKSLDIVGGFVCPGSSYYAGSACLMTDRPWQDLSNTTFVEELDYIVYPLVSEGPTSLVHDLLCKLPQFKERPLFYFGTPLMISIFAGKLDTVKMLLQDLHVNANTRGPHYDCNCQVVPPIFLAFKYRQDEVVKWLLDCGSAPVFFPGRPAVEWLEHTYRLDEESSRGHQTFALTIGINTYKSETFKSETLQGAVNDANKFEEYLCEDLGTPKENIISLRNEQATRSAIIDGFRSLERNPNIVKNMAAIIIYYAGHGAVAQKPVEWKDWETPDDKIEMLCPYDIGSRDDNDKVVDGIPDRTISQLLLDLSTITGNNITLILDCCHAAGINRGGGVGGSIDLEEGRMEVRARTFRNVQNVSPACDADIYSPKSSLSGSLRDSHVLLAACRRSQSASEINGKGIFTDALLRCMRDKPLVGVLTYASLLHRLDMPDIQTPHLDGKHIRRRLFDSWESPADSSMILCRCEEDRFVLSAGSLHGITVDSTFAIYGTDLSDPHHQLATAVVNTVEPFVSYLHLPDKDFFTAYKDNPVYARLDKASGSNLAIHCNSSDFLHNILTDDREPRLTVPAIATEIQLEADLCLTVKGSTAYFDRGNKNSIISASMGFPSRFSSGVDVKDITRIRRVIDRYSQFNSHLTRPGSLPISDYISIEMYELRTDKGRLSPTGDNILPDGEEKPVEFVIDLSSQEKFYGFTICNTSPVTLYAYLFCFDASTLEIVQWYSPDLGNGKKSNVIDTGLLPGSIVTLGFGSGGMHPVTFFIPDGQEVDLCFFKIFVTTKATDLGSISQPSPFSESTQLGARLKSSSEIIGGAWASRIIPIVLRSATTFQGSSVPSSISCSEKGPTKPAEDYMYGLEKWLVASWQRMERFLLPLHQSYAAPNGVLRTGRSEWEKN